MAGRAVIRPLADNSKPTRRGGLTFSAGRTAENILVPAAAPLYVPSDIRNPNPLVAITMGIGVGAAIFRSHFQLDSRPVTSCLPLR